MSYDKGDSTKYWVIMENGAPKKVTLEEYTSSYGVIPTESDRTTSGPFEGSTFGGRYSDAEFATNGSAPGTPGTTFKNSAEWTSDMFLSASNSSL